ncbi:hypothetical protein EG359_09120 [Chryseobacterium joostei]|uniref:YD repeat-containing protein n=1 Tax=Chryseobacterium joostei TaxID=112234 RepID=A0A1N7I3J7_9FLAO|nr:hypothetical protein [Chryseobacterium joostei]AZA99768.1 hypothetical protein EG359_09120 [Chryseobacterium joostei]SIS31610.1 hypothetical protein SAMN05421768_102471 [Chryseobacterium joostei]
MKKIIIPIGILLMMGTLHAQEVPKMVPRVIAPNLDANALGVFDKQSVNLSTGTPSIGVLLHAIRVGDMELPIKLQYDASGIKVGQMATSVGLGWSINNSGVLTQEVKDKIDGQSNNVIQQYLNTNTIDGRNTILYNHKYITQPYTGDDLETDSYNINYFGNTIPFLYNYNSNTYIPQQKDDTRIIKEANKWTVTLNDGTEFNFDQQYASKSVSSTKITKSPQAAQDSNSSPNFNDSWYLTKIASKGQSATLAYLNSSSIYVSRGDETNDALSLIRSTESFKVISEITTPFEKVVFEYSSEREDLISKTGKADLLKFIKVYDTYGKLVKQFQLFYDYYNETQSLPDYASVVANASNIYKNKRLRLRAVKRLNIQTGIYENYYSFDYNSDTLPNRFSASQDIWGYYNGENNGDYMFSNTEQKKLKVNPQYALTGLLTKVTYPTGGFSEYTYESNVAARPVNYNLMIPSAIDGILKTIRLNRMPMNYKGNGKYEIPFTVDGPIVGNLFRSQVNISNCPGNIYSTTCNYKVMIDGSWLNPGTLDNNANSLTIGNHVLTAQANGHTEDPDNLEVPYFFSVGMQWQEKQSDTAPILVGGQRVQKIISKDNASTYTQEFAYVNEDGTTSGTILTLPFVASTNSYGVIYSQGSNPLSKLSGQNLVYRRVERMEKNSSGLPNGKTVQYFKKPITNTNFNKIPFPPPDNKSHTYGELTKEEYFKYDDIANKFNKIEESNYFYTYPEKCNIDNPTPDCITRLKGLSYSDVFNITNTSSTIYDNFDWGLYSLEASPYKLLSKTSTKYLDNGGLTTKEEMDYTSSIHNNLTKSVTTFPDNTIQETSYQYAHEQNNTDMITANMIGIPLQTEVKENGKVISKVRSIYGKNAQTSNLVLPVSEQKFDSDNTASAQSIVSYDQYDANGNILQYTTKGSVPTAIIWGYKNTQPIARIEGATYQEAAALAADIIAKSNEDVDADKEKALMNALDTYRNQSAFKNHSITTYTYDPQVGVTSITPPTGIREFYKYDSMNRLQSVVDANNNILKEFNYHYKN